MSWKTLTNTGGQRFPFVDYCTIEPLLQRTQGACLWSGTLVNKKKYLTVISTYTMTACIKANDADFISMLDFL